MTTTAEPTGQLPPHLTAAQQKHSRDKRSRVRAALHGMLREGEVITFAEVARRARVSRSLVYTSGVREEIENGRSQLLPAKRPPAPSRVPRSEVLLLKQRNEKLRTEVTELRHALRQKLGQEVEFGDVGTLRGEIEELNHDNDALRSRIGELGDELEAERTQRIELEDALSASRELVKKMIKDDNAP
jgi:chromosome segregation ATPase